MIYEEAQAALAWQISLDRWYDMPRWARVGSVALLRLERKMARWGEIWREKPKG